MGEINSAKGVTPTPFKISISDSLLSFINQRVSTARIPPSIKFPPSQEWNHGIPSSKISKIQSYWKDTYDWRSIESRINTNLEMFTLPIQEADEVHTIHFVHHRSSNPNAVPLLFQHGWPGSFLEVTKIINLLTSPNDPPAQAYHVVAPSLPGFAFSSTPQNPDFRLQNIAVINHKLMTALGYTRYMAQGGDWGSMVIRMMAASYPQNCVAVHVNMAIAGPPSWYRYPFHLVFMIIWAVWQSIYGTKETGFARMLRWRKEEQGYLEIQGTKPQNLAYGLVDSPVGMLAWLLYTMEVVVDDDFVWSEEECITWAMMYTIPGTAGHSTIYTNVKGSKRTLFQAEQKILPRGVDFGASIFPKDVLYIPEWGAACTISSNIIYWKEHDKGGHFPSSERPEILVEDIREFTSRIRRGNKELMVKSGKVKD